MAVIEVSQEQFNASLASIERGESTVEDRNAVRAYVDRLLSHIRRLEQEIEQLRYGDDTGMLL